MFEYSRLENSQWLELNLWSGRFGVEGLVGSLGWGPEMVVATVLQAAQASLAVASTSRCRKEGVFGAQCSSVVTSSRARRATVSIQASSSSDSKVGYHVNAMLLNINPIECT